MDRITLQHYEERAAKGRAIVDKIERLLDAVSKAKKSRNVSISTLSGHDILVVAPNQNGQLPNDARTHLSALMINVFIDNIACQIREHEAELAEL